MIQSLVRGALVVVPLGLMLGSCCSGPRCREVNSGPDRDRTRAAPIKLAEVANDEVNGEKKDATDWKYVEVKRPGKLTVTLHWDSEGADLLLSVHDGIGKQLQQGLAWGQKGRRAELKRAMPGRYYIRVQAAGADRSTYSVEAELKKTPPPRCHDCTPGERICLKKDGYAFCGETPYGCNAWIQTFACPKDQSCNQGKCVKGCTDQCKSEERRCSGSKGYQVCRTDSSGCLRWSDVIGCAQRRVCKEAKCVKRKRGGGRPRPAVAATPAAGAVKGKIISIYRFRGQMMLHIELPDDASVRPGQRGQVLAGGADTPVPGGEVKVIKVSGRYCKAQTTLEKLGKNRWVRFR